LVLCIAPWQGKHTGNLDHSRGKRRLRVGPDEKDRIVIVAVTVSLLDGCLRLSYAAQSAKGGSSVSLELSVKLFKNIFTSGEQPVAHGDVPVPRESSGKLGLCCACGKSGINSGELGPRRWLPAALWQTLQQSFACGRFVQLYEIDVNNGAEEPWRLAVLNAHRNKLLIFARRIELERGGPFRFGEFRQKIIP
jgi:hypothetical protein